MMSTAREGEIICKERYGSSKTSRVYVKPADQLNIVAVEENKFGNWHNVFATIFLPQGYPDSVSKDYLEYQIWDTAQAFCSTITGTLATKEVLQGVGVGDMTATAMAATFLVVIRDSCGHIGRIIFAYMQGSYLDAYSKKWRLYADVLNDAAMGLELALPLYKSITPFVLTATTVMKAIVGVAGGASRAAMTQHHAIRGNMADVSAKDSAQETAVNVIASLAALPLLQLFGWPYIHMIFVTLMILHIIFNYLAVRAVCLNTFNETRFIQLIEKYLKRQEIASPWLINQSEPILLYNMGMNLLDLKLCGFKMKIGHSVRELLIHNMKASYVRKINDIYSSSSYILYPDVPRNTMYVVLRENITATETLAAYFHGVLLSIAICAINDYSLPVYKSIKYESRPFAKTWQYIQEAPWARVPANDAYSQFRQYPSLELMIYVNKLAKEEWKLIEIVIKQMGWDLTKHVLVVNEWRISTDRSDARAPPPADDKVMDSPPDTSSTTSEPPTDVFRIEADISNKLIENVAANPQNKSKDV